MAKYDIYVLGMRRELFVGQGPGESSFDEVPETNERDILFCVTCQGRCKFTITLTTLFGWCGSGYTTATWGQMDVDRVTDFGPATHLPKNRKIKLEGAVYDASKSFKEGLHFESVDVDWHDPWYEDIINNVFSISSDGGDTYYPMGGTNINEDLFTELPRAFDKRPVWILNGQSGTGKSTIGSILRSDGKIVYETDSANNGDLPKEIWADVIVVGNKWKDISVETVKQHLPEDCKTVEVTFSM